jgi:hypothetical protein
VELAFRGSDTNVHVDPEQYQRLSPATNSLLLVSGCTKLAEYRTFWATAAPVANINDALIN